MTSGPIEEGKSFAGWRWTRVPDGRLPPAGGWSRTNSGLRDGSELGLARRIGPARESIAAVSDPGAGRRARRGRPEADPARRDVCG